MVVATADAGKTQAEIPLRFGKAQLGGNAAALVPDLHQVIADGIGVFVRRHAVLTDDAVIRVVVPIQRALQMRIPDRTLDAAPVWSAGVDGVLHQPIHRAERLAMRAAVTFFAGDQQQIARLPQRVVVLVISAVVGERQPVQAIEHALADLIRDADIARPASIYALAQRRAIGGVVVVHMGVTRQPAADGRCADGGFLACLGGQGRLCGVLRGAAGAEQQGQKGEIAHDDDPVERE